VKRMVFEGEASVTGSPYEASVEFRQPPFILADRIKKALGVEPLSETWVDLGKVRITIEPVEEG